MPYFEGIPFIKHWRSSPAPINAGAGTSNGTLMIAPIDVDGEPWPGSLLANSFAIGVSGNLTATSVSQALTSTFRIGLYTRNQSTLNLINSASLGISNSAAATANTSNWNGVRFIVVVSSLWSATPILIPGERYYIAMNLVSAVTTAAMSWLNAATFATAFSGGLGHGQGGGAPNATAQPFSPFRGVYTASTTGMPATIQASQVNGSGANMSFMPWFRIDNDFRNY